MKGYLILVNQEQKGPYTIEQLRSMWSSGQLTLHTLFWQDGMAGWEAIEGLKLDSPIQPLASSSQKTLTPGIPTCHQCGGSMTKTVVSSGNCSGLVLALIAFCVGILIFFALPIIGWVLGPIICLGALFMGGKRSKVWKCIECGSVVNRENTSAGLSGIIMAALVIGIVVYAVRNPKDQPPPAPTAATQQTPRPATPTPPQDVVPSPPPPTTPATTPALPTPASIPPQFVSVEQAQQEALRRYPDLGVAGSKFNAEFIVRHQRYKRENPAFLQDTSWPIRLAEETATAIGPQVKTPIIVPQAKRPAPDRYVIHMGDDSDMYFQELGAANNSLGMEIKWTVKRSAKVQTKAEAERTMQGMQSIAKAGGFYAPLKLEPAE